MKKGEFHYEKQRNVSIPQAVWIACNQVFSEIREESYCFNTASGMDCMQFAWQRSAFRRVVGFNTASGMDCMQCKRKKSS